MAASNCKHECLVIFRIICRLFLIIVGIVVNIAGIGVSVRERIDIIEVKLIQKILLLKNLAAFC